MWVPGVTRSVFLPFPPLLNSQHFLTHTEPLTSALSVLSPSAYVSPKSCLHRMSPLPDFQSLFNSPWIRILLHHSTKLCSWSTWRACSDLCVDQFDGCFLLPASLDWLNSIWPDWSHPLPWNSLSLASRILLAAASHSFCRHLLSWAFIHYGALGQMLDFLFFLQSLLKAFLPVL